MGLLGSGFAPLRFTAAMGRARAASVAADAVLDDDAQPHMLCVSARTRHWCRRCNELPRRRRLQRELKDAEAALGEPINMGNVRRIVDDLAEVLRRSGNRDLGDEYRAAFERFRVACEKVEENNDRGDIDVATSDAMNDAVEAFEHVEAEVLACSRLGKDSA